MVMFGHHLAKQIKHALHARGLLIFPAMMRKRQPRKKHRCLPSATSNHDRRSRAITNGKKGMTIFFSKYPQTWGVACKVRKIPLVGKWIYKALQLCCGLLTRHEASQTEWGYGIGNGYGDVWCRWCNKMGQIPLSELSRYENARHTIWGVTGCDINQFSQVEKLVCGPTTNKIHNRNRDNA